MLLSIVKASGGKDGFIGILEDNMQKFEPQIPCPSSHMSPNIGLEPQGVVRLLRQKKS